MTVIKYSKKKSGNKKLSNNFSLFEFACNDGSDKVLIDDKLIQILQAISNHFNKPVNITSAYRTPKYNAKIKGASNSYHLKGMACDIWVSDVSPMDVAKYAERLGVIGIGYYPDDRFVHVDTRIKKYFWIKRASYQTVLTHGGKPTYADNIKKSSGVGDSTIKYLMDYNYPYALIEKLSKAMK